MVDLYFILPSTRRLRYCFHKCPQICHEDANMTTSLRKGCIGLAILLGYFLLVSLPCPDGLSPNGKRAIAMMFAAVLIWVFEILPVAVASVLFAVLPAVCLLYTSRCV